MSTEALVYKVCVHRFVSIACVVCTYRVANEPETRDDPGIQEFELFTFPLFIISTWK